MVKRAVGQTSTSQPALAIEAKDAYKHIGEQVIVYDSLYSGKIVQDSLVVCQIGMETNTPRLTAIFISRIDRHWDQRFFHTMQRHKIWLNGTITGNKDAPVIIIDGTKGVSMDDAGDAHPHK